MSSQTTVVVPARVWLLYGCRHLDITTTRELNEVKEGLQLAFIEQMVTRDQMYITSTVRPEALVIVSGTLVGVLGSVQECLAHSTLLHLHRLCSAEKG